MLEWNFRTNLYEEVEDTTEICKGCGDVFESCEMHKEEYGNDYYCDDCWWEKLAPTFTYENALKIGGQNKVTIEINDFLWDLIGRSENTLKDIIMKEFTQDEAEEVEDYAARNYGLEWETELYIAERKEREEKNNE